MSKEYMSIEDYHKLLMLKDLKIRRLTEELDRVIKEFKDYKMKVETAVEQTLKIEKDYLNQIKHLEDSLKKAKADEDARKVMK